MGIRKRVTEKQLHANRQNSRKSTGPKTPSGKKQSSLNAWKHGILSSQVMASAACCGEDVESFASLLGDLRTEWQPHGTMEDLLVQQIAIGYWRLVRVHKLEAGEITKNSEKADIVQEELLLQSSDPNLLRRNPEGLKQVFLLFALAKLGLETNGFIGDKVLNDLCIALEPYVGSSVKTILITCNGTLKEHKSKDIGDRDQTVSYAYEQTMELLEGRCRPAIEARLAISEVKMKFASEGVRLRASLPASDAIDLILRYETWVLGCLDRARMQLERLQLARTRKRVSRRTRVSLLSE